MICSSAVSRLVIFGVSEVDIPSYIQYRRDRGSHRGGLLVYISASLQSQRRPDLEVEGVEVIWVELHVHTKSILLGSMYHPPNADNEVLDSLAGMLDLVERESKEMVIMGDLNCAMHGPSHSPDATNLLHITEEHNLTEPTRVTNHSESLIDLLLTSNPSIFSSSGTAPLLGSDHLMIFGESCGRVALKATVSYMRNYKKCEVKTLLSDLGNAPWQVMDTFDDIDKWTYWNNLFLSVVDRYAPLMKVRVKKDKCEWLDGDIRSMTRSRNYYRREFETRSQDIWEKYKALRNEVNLKVRQAKVFHFSTICQELKKQPRLAWKRLNSALGHRKGSSNVIQLDFSHKTLTDKSTIANKLVDHFTPLPPSCPAGLSSSLSPIATTLHFSELREEDVLRKLIFFGSGKATGPDRISVRLLRMVAPTISCSLTKLFNKSLLTGHFPSEWKDANITPRTQIQDVNSYRPISILPIIAKLFEFFVTKQLRDYLKSNKLLNVAQSGI